MYQFDLSIYNKRADSPEIRDSIKNVLFFFFVFLFVFSQNYFKLLPHWMYVSANQSIYLPKCCLLLSESRQ